MEATKPVLDLGEESLGQRVAQKMNTAAESTGRQVDAAVGYMDEAKSEVTQAFDSIKKEGWNGLKQRAVDYTRQEPLSALAVAAAAGILLGWVTMRGK